jgi:glycine dehydrogenase subunit 2
MGMNMQTKLRDFHQARWDEPIIYELSTPGERGVLLPEIEEGIQNSAKDAMAKLPSHMVRSDYANLPEMGQMRVLKHYLRLSQENLGADLNIDIGQGTCTMKYNPKINEELARNPKISKLHPYQDESTVQGALEIIYNMDHALRAISGMDAFSLQTGGGSQALYSIISIIRAWVEHTKQTETKDEIITTIYSHPSNAAVAKLKGFKVITIYPGADGRPDYEALKNAVSERTAALMITNPEDIGIYNSRIKEFTDLVHSVGGLCSYDQANLNGIMGITRAREAGFDICFFNLHKTFSAPHGCGGPGSGAVGVTDMLKPFLPVPVVEKNLETGAFFLNNDLAHTIGKNKNFYGTISAILKAYAWVRALGADGIKEAARVAVLNNNYMFRKILAIRGASAPYAEGEHRIEQVRYSWQKLKEETGITTNDVQNRMFDFGVHYWTSHEPWIVPEPFTIEPTESYSKQELDEFLAITEQIVKEAYENPEIVKTAPHNSTIHHVHHEYFDDPEKWAITWRVYNKKYQGYFEKKETEE